MWYLWLDKQYAFCFVHIGDCRVNFTLLLPSQRFDCSFSFSLRLSLSVSISDSIWLNEIYSLITLILIRWTNYIYEFVFLWLFSSSSSLKCCSKTCFAHCLYRVRFWSKKKLKSKSVICWCFFFSPKHAHFHEFDPCRYYTLCVLFDAIPNTNNNTSRHFVWISCTRRIHFA